MCHRKFTALQSIPLLTCSMFLLVIDQITPSSSSFHSSLLRAPLSLHGVGAALELALRWRVDGALGGEALGGAPAARDGWRRWRPTSGAAHYIPAPCASSGATVLHPGHTHFQPPAHSRPAGWRPAAPPYFIRRRDSRPAWNFAFIPGPATPSTVRKLGTQGIDRGRRVAGGY